MNDTIVIVGHPVRKCVEADFEEKKYLIKFDGFKSEEHNEDPFIWNKKILYSFCHANVALSKRIIDKIAAKENVYFVFVARKNNKSQIMEIDTVIKADKIIKWPEKNNRKASDIKDIFKSIFKNKEERDQAIDNIVKYHLPGIKEKKCGEDEIGNLIHRNNKTLHTCVGDTGKSFLPMVKSDGGYQPYTFNETESELLLKLLKRGHKNAFYPIVWESLDGERKSEYHELCQKIIEEVINNKKKRIKKVKGQMLQEVHDKLRPKK